MILTDDFREEVQALRDEGWTWPEVAELTGRSKRTCQRAIERPERICAHHGCRETTTWNGRLCPAHAKLAMRNKPGHGPRQQQVMRQVRRHGFLSSEQLRNLTGLDSTSLGQVTTRLVRLGLLERPMMGYYRLPTNDHD
jgi:Homeodomain-like domain